jgi:hypothetical protein
MDGTRIVVGFVTKGKLPPLAGNRSLIIQPQTENLLASVSGIISQSY